MSDFRIPSESLSVSPISFGEEAQSLATLQRSENLNAPIIQEAFKGATQLTGFLYDTAQKSAHAQMQSDVLKVGEKLENLAKNLVQNQQWTWGGPSSPNPTMPSAAGPGGQTDLTEAPASHALTLDSSFDKTIQEEQQRIREQYKAFPAVQDEAMTLLRPMIENAYKTAYSGAFDKINDQGKTAVIDQAERASKMAVQTGDDSALQAVFANPDNRGFFTAEEWDTLKRRETDNASKGIAMNAGIKALKTGGLVAGQDAATTVGGDRDLSPADIVTLGSRIEALQRQALAGYTQQALAAEADALKNGTSLEAAADKLDAQAEYPAVMKTLTDNMRVDGQMEPVVALLRQGQDTAAANLLETIGNDQGWTDDQRKHATTALNQAKTDWTMKDEGTASSILQWWATSRQKLMAGTFDGGTKAALGQLGALMADSQANGVFGTKAAQAANSALGELDTFSKERSFGEPAQSDPKTVVYFMNAIKGTGLNTADVKKYSDELDDAFQNKHTLTQGNYSSFKALLVSPSAPMLSSALTALRALNTGPDGKVNEANFAADSLAFVNQWQASPNKSADDITAAFTTVHNARIQETATAALSALSPNSPVRNFFRGIVGLPSLEQQGTLTKEAVLALKAVSDGTFVAAIKGGDQDAGTAVRKLQDLAVQSFQQQFGAAFPPKSINRNLFLNKKTGEYALMSITDSKGQAWLPVVKDDKLTWVKM